MLHGPGLSLSAKNGFYIFKWLRKKEKKRGAGEGEGTGQKRDRNQKGPAKLKIIWSITGKAFSPWASPSYAAVSFTH